MDLSAFREEYLKDTLHRRDLAATPFEQFDRWFKQALESGIPEPNAMSIATATPQGMPSLRTVLLKYYDDRGYVFFTNYTSRKAREIEANPEMCMLLPWVYICQTLVHGHGADGYRAVAQNPFARFMDILAGGDFSCIFPPRPFTKGSCQAWAGV